MWQASESDLMQLQLKHENESLQMARLVQEHEARLAYQMKLHEEYEVRDVRKDEIENAQDCASCQLWCSFLSFCGTLVCELGLVAH